jgi:hypothetical protein
MSRLILCLAFSFFVAHSAISQTPIFGYVKDKTSGEPLVGVNVKAYSKGSISQINVYGFFALNSLKQP